MSAMHSWRGAVALLAVTCRSGGMLNRFMLLSGLVLGGSVCNGQSLAVTPRASAQVLTTLQQAQPTSAPPQAVGQAAAAQAAVPLAALAQNTNSPTTVASDSKPKSADASDAETVSRNEASPELSAEGSQRAVAGLEEWLGGPGQGGVLWQEGAVERLGLTEKLGWNVPLTRADAERAAALLVDNWRKAIQAERAAEMESKVIKVGELEMPFHVEKFGDAPATGRSLYISMHGGGNAPARVNDRQWENQKKLYQLEEGIYVAPRAPTNTWNLWHEAHIDQFFDRLIQNMVVFENVDPNRVYIMGYSAGGDGVFQLAPRMADRWAAAAMMAGHPNETVPLGLRNTAFTLHMGGRDAAYSRNQVAEQWKTKLAELRTQDPQGYEHWVQIYPDKGHWMDREDAAAIPWMAKFSRRRWPEKIVWKQDDVTQSRFYWLAVAPDQQRGGAEVTATREASRFTVTATGVEQIKLRANDEMFDLDGPLELVVGNRPAERHQLRRSLAVLHATLAERGDPSTLFSAELTVNTAP